MCVCVGTRAATSECEYVSHILFLCLRLCLCVLGPEASENFQMPIAIPTRYFLLDSLKCIICKVFKKIIEIISEIL